MTEKTLFFVYGTLRRSEGNSQIFKHFNAEWLGNHTTEAEYTMYSHGGFPSVAEKGKTSIVGEVWSTDNPDCVKRIHGLEGYSGTPGSSSNWYDAKQIDTPYGKAWMFIMNDYHSGEISSGDWLKRTSVY